MSASLPECYVSMEKGFNPTVKHECKSAFLIGLFWRFNEQKHVKVKHNVRELEVFSKSCFLTGVGIFQKARLRQKNPYGWNNKEEVK